MTRPTEIECEGCGATVAVAPKGRVPKLCADCRSAARSQPDEDDSTRVSRDFGDDTETDHLTDEDILDVADVAEMQPPSPPTDAKIWPKRIAPCAWVDQSGRRHTDLGRAREAVEALRRRS